MAVLALVRFVYFVKNLNKMEEVKEDISLRLLCNACLCVGRTLYQVTEEALKRYYFGALSEIPLCGMPALIPTICWECKALLCKAINFREQVKDSYRILMTYTSENLNECLLTDVTRPPRLKIKNNESVDIGPDSTFEVISEYLDGKYSSCLDVDNKVEENQETKSVANDILEDKALKDSPVFSDVILGLQQTQEVFVKEELKVEEWDSDRDFSDGPIEVNQKSTQKDNLRVVDDEIRSIIGESEIKTDNTKKAKNRISKRKKGKVRSKKKIKKRKEDSVNVPSIQSIDLTYDEMVAEREKEYTKDSYVNAEYKCETCIVGFNYHKSYKTHLTNKHSPDIGNYTCPICKTVLVSVDSFTAHYKRHMRRYECSICQKRTMDMKVMQQHYYTTHEISLKKYKCTDCGKISNSIDSHRYHTDTHKSRLQCTECDKTFRHRGGLLNHRLAVHELRNMFPCNHCDKVFRWKNSLKRHLDSHEAKNKCSSGSAYCALCGVSFASLSSYQRHMNSSLKHVTKEHFRFICDHCNRRFADKTKLRDHIEEKHLHKTYQCSICLKVSKNRVNLDQHIRNVHKGRPNNKMCHHCGKGFPTKVQLESHIRTHTGERPFICEYCPTTFSQQSNLYKHNRQVHLNLKTKRYPIAKKRKDRPESNLDTSEIPIEYAIDIQFPIV